MIGVERTRPFIEWLKKHNLRGFIGEYGIPAHPQWLEAMDNLLSYLGRAVRTQRLLGGGSGLGRLSSGHRNRRMARRSPRRPCWKKHLNKHDCEVIGPR